VGRNEAADPVHSTAPAAAAAAAAPLLLGY